MSRPKKQLNRRTDILDSAQKLFAEKSFEKTTIDDIAKYSGIGKGSVYLDFKNKDDILHGIIERHAISSVERLELLITDAKPPYLNILRRIIKLEVLTAFDMVTSQVHTHIGLMHTSYKMRQELSHIIQKTYELTASILAKAENNREIAPFDNYKNLAYLIDICFKGFFPPYDLKYSPEIRIDISKEEIRSLLLNDISIVSEIIISGLKTAKYGEINIRSNYE